MGEPLVHFALLGTGLFALYASLNDSSTGAGRQTILVDEVRLDQLQAQFQRVWQRPPTPDERQHLIDGWIREEILYREGLSMGLDRSDPVIRRRVAQKLAFMSEGLAVTVPTVEQLEAWLAANADDYRLEPEVTFQQVLVASAPVGDDAARRAAESVAALNEGVPSRNVGVVSLLPPGQRDVRLSQVARTFGGTFAESLQHLPLGVWHGPVRSGYGVHVVMVDALTPGRMPDLDDVRAAVERDYLKARSEEANQSFYESLRARYQITVQTADRSPESET